MKVLMIEDDETLSQVMKLYLEHYEYSVEVANDGLKGIVKATQYKPDIILLDYMLPKISGLEVCEQIRTFSNVPILMISARSDEDEKVACLEAGADDYITKPFSQRELVARMKTHLRRMEELNRSSFLPDSSSSSEKIRFSAFEVNRSKFKAYWKDQEINLTKKEFSLLWILAKQPNEVIPRKYLIEQVWGYMNAEDDRSMDTHMNRLRAKLKDVSHIQIRTLWGVGYKLEVSK